MAWYRGGAATPLRSVRIFKRMTIVSSLLPFLAAHFGLFCTQLLSLYVYLLTCHCICYGDCRIRRGMVVDNDDAIKNSKTAGGARFGMGETRGPVMWHQCRQTGKKMSAMRTAFYGAHALHACCTLLLPLPRLAGG